MFIGAYISVAGQRHSLNGAFVLFRRFSYWFCHPTESLSAAMSQWLFFGPSAASSLVLTSAFLICLIIVLSQPVLSRPLERFLTFLSERKANLFALIAGFLSVVSAFAGLFLA